MLFGDALSVPARASLAEPPHISDGKERTKGVLLHLVPLLHLYKHVKSHACALPDLMNVNMRGFQFIVWVLVQLVTAFARESHVNVTAIVSANAVTSDAHFECWRLAAPLTEYPTVGKSMNLAQVSNVTYVVLPPRSEEGLHRPPHPM